MEYSVKNGEVAFKKDRKILVQETILAYCDQFKRIPSIEQYNNYQANGFTINEFLQEHNLVYSHLIYEVLGLKQTKKGVVPVNGLKVSFQHWIEDYQAKHHELPTYEEAKERIQFFLKDALFGREMQNFLKQFGIKRGRKRLPPEKLQTINRRILHDRLDQFIDEHPDETAWIFAAVPSARLVIKFG